MSQLPLVAIERQPTGVHAVGLGSRLALQPF